MNIALLDPFELNIPNEITNTLNHSLLTTCISFNRRGSLLAAGSRLGTCFIWDLATVAVSVELKGHAYPITMLSWSRCGRYLLSCSLDWNCIIWDLKTKRRQDTIRFSSPVLGGVVHPKFSDTFCVITQQHTPTLMIKSQNEWTRSSLIPPDKYANLLASTVTFTPNGNHIFVGTNKGTILVYSTQTQEVLFVNLV